METKTNQTYTIDEKTGNIIKVEEANEKQKKQKLMLKAKIAALCTAIAISGIAVFTSKTSKSNNLNNETVTTELDNNQEKNDSIVDEHLTPDKNEATTNNNFVPNENQTSNYMIIKSEKGTGYYNDVIEFFNKTGSVNEFPDELVEAFFELGQDNFELAKQTGLARYSVNHQNINQINAEQQNQFGPNNIQAENYAESQKKEAEDYYYKVMNFFNKNGNVNEFPDELVEAFFELRQDNFELAKQTGLSRNLFGDTNSQNQVEDTVSAERVR